MNFFTSIISVFVLLQSVSCELVATCETRNPNTSFLSDTKDFFEKADRIWECGKIYRNTDISSYYLYHRIKYTPHQVCKDHDVRANYHEYLDYLRFHHTVGGGKVHYKGVGYDSYKSCIKTLSLPSYYNSKILEMTPGNFLCKDNVEENMEKLGSIYCDENVHGHGYGDLPLLRLTVKVGIDADDANYEECEIIGPPIAIEYSGKDTDYPETEYTEESDYSYKKEYESIAYQGQKDDGYMKENFEKSKIDHHLKETENDDSSKDTNILGEEDFFLSRCCVS